MDLRLESGRAWNYEGNLHILYFIYSTVNTTIIMVDEDIDLLVLFIARTQRLYQHTILNNQKK